MRGPWLQRVVFTAAALVLCAVGLGAPQPPPARQVMLAFLRGADDEQVWVAAADGTGATRISTADEEVVTPIGYSAKAGLLAWWSILDMRDGESVYGLRVWPVTGGTPKTIYEDAQATYWVGADPQFTPDGKFIIFGRATDEYGPNDETRDWGLWQIAVDGTHVQQLTKGFGTSAGSGFPTVSPDGKMIAFYRIESQESGRLCLVSRTGGKVRQTPVWVREFLWWPQSDAVLLTDPDGEDTDRLASYSLRTRKFAALVSNWGGRMFHGPRFSPDGTRLACGVTALEGSWVRVYEMRPGRSPKRLVNVAAPVAGLDPVAWSPTGDRLFFSTYDAKRDLIAIWSMRPDGAGRHKVLDGATLGVAFLR